MPAKTRAEPCITAKGFAHEAQKKKTEQYDPPADAGGLPVSDRLHFRL